MNLSTANERFIKIQPKKGLNWNSFTDLWRFRELLYFLVWRDVKVRYKQTLLGFSWAVIKPFFAMVIFSIFLGRYAKIPSDGLPYPIFAYCGLLPWQLFSFALTDSGNSLVNNRNLITKVYFPRIIVPLSSIITGVIDFAAAFSVLLLMMAYYKIVPTTAIVLLPLLVLLTMATAIAVGVWFSALNVQYRDVRYAIPFLIQFWLFATPVAYPSSLLPEKWQAIYGLNPMAGVVEGFRWILLGQANPPFDLMIVSSVVVILLFISGLYYFERMESTFADRI